MDLILWRHAEAGASLADPGLDLERSITAKGERQARRTAEWLGRYLPDSTRVLSSPARRCLETARLLERPVKVRDELGPDGSVDALLDATRWPEAHRAVLVVGHQPTLGRVAAYLMAGAVSLQGPPWSVKKGAVWWLRHRPRAERGEVVLVAVRAPDGL